MIKAKAILTAFHSFHDHGDTLKVRPIEFDDTAKDDMDTVFEAAFYHGQNEVQRVAGCYSVSCGDVIEIVCNGSPMWRVVESYGFSAPMTRIGTLKFIRAALRDRADRQGVAVPAYTLRIAKDALRAD